MLRTSFGCMKGSLWYCTIDIDGVGREFMLRTSFGCMKGSQNNERSSIPFCLGNCGDVQMEACVLALNRTVVMFRWRSVYWLWKHRVEFHMYTRGEKHKSFSSFGWNCCHKPSSSKEEH
jgi:hypothetical protein